MFLYEEIERYRKTQAAAPPPFIEDIEENLNPEYPLRPYQIQAFSNFITYFERLSPHPYPAQTLFHMATGSGKTLIMAGLMLYLYSKGYRHFLFFVHLETILKKTKDNFLNPVSLKYLFAEHIRLKGEDVKLQEVRHFQGLSEGRLNICFTTIQGLHRDLWHTKENSLTLEDFREQKIVLISDEAHHLLVDTKKQKSREEAEAERSWEYSVQAILGTNPANVLLEFTATCDLTNPYIKREYAPKIIFDYPLGKFRTERYSKEVKTLRSDLPLMQRAIQAVLLSQYRLKRFQDHGLNIKPVVLFKALTKEQSKTFMDGFHEVIARLSPDALQHIREAAGTNPLLLAMYTYFDQKGISLAVLAQELKEEFSQERCLSMNDHLEAEKVQLIVNSLEDKNNPYRAIFQVKKLDEGWDVLNLFDIVRLYENRDSQKGRPGKTTVAEAQLIGRGARYCPFVVNYGQEKYTRKFDENLDHPLRVCEELVYHCQNDSRYIAELKQALVEEGIWAKERVERHYHLKEAFKQGDFYQKGLVFLNQRLEKSPKSVSSLPDAIRQREYTVFWNTSQTTVTTLFDNPAALPDDEEAKVGYRVEGTSERKASSIGNKAFENPTRTFSTGITLGELAELNYSLVHKALRQYEIFTFSNLIQRFPNLTSIREFISASDYLGAIGMTIHSKDPQIPRIAYYHACVQTVGKIAQSLGKAEVSYEGSREFVPQYIHEAFPDQQRVSFSDPQGVGFGVPQSSETIVESMRLDLAQEDWYVYNDNFGTVADKLFVKQFKTYAHRLQDHYAKVYLVKNVRHLKIYTFGEGEPITPDYLLFLQTKKEIGSGYRQIFLKLTGDWSAARVGELENFFQAMLKEEFPHLPGDALFTADAGELTLVSAQAELNWSMYFQRI